MSKLTIVATVKSLPGAEKKVQRELVGLVGATRAEEGCLEYRLHNSIENSATFLIYENWESRQLWENHMASPHFLTFKQNTEALVGSLEIYQLAEEII